MTNDPAESDPAALSSAEDLDEDELQVDPLEEGMEPPEHWSAADSFGTAPIEQQEGESLEQRVSEEQPDVDSSQSAASPRPTEEIPLDELDENIDNAPVQNESLVAEQPVSQSPESGQWQNADEGAGSIADEIREPREPE